MPRGRPPLSPEQYDARLRRYCSKYGVTSVEGLPSYPAGRRETPQHREWMALYKARERLARRLRKAAPGVRSDQLGRQGGRCPICTRSVQTTGVLDEDRTSGRVYGLLHAECERLVRLARDAGTGALERLRSYLAAEGADSATKDR